MTFLLAAAGAEKKVKSSLHNFRLFRHFKNTLKHLLGQNLTLNLILPLKLVIIKPQIALISLVNEIFGADAREDRGKLTPGPIKNEIM